MVLPYRSNILPGRWNEQSIHFIDWSDGRYADPVDELGYIKAINDLPDENMRTLLESFCPIIHDRDIYHRLPIYKLKNRIFDVIWAFTMIDRSTTDVERKLY